MTGTLEPGDPGHVGRYRLLGRLGEGGMGRVYLGASPAGRAVAIKVVRAELAGDESFRARFRAEVEAAKKVGGAFTSPVVDADPDGTVPWLATAYVNGLDLKDAVDRHGPMPEPRLRTLGAGLGEALVAVHQAGLLHRDLKPANILLAKDGPRVIDFGISRASDGTRLTADGQFIGTPGYMAPEQIRGTDLTSATDVFAFGAVLAFAATGRPPFGTGAVHTVIHRTLHEPPDLEGVPPSLAAMVAACLSTDPSRRPPVALLSRLLAAPPAAPGWLPDTLGRELERRETTLVADLRSVTRARTRRRLLIAGAATAGLALAGGGTAVALARNGHAPPPPTFLWEADLKTGSDIMSPQIFARAVVVSTASGTSHSFDRATGRRLWSGVTYDACADDLIYARPSDDETLVAFDPYTRSPRWSRRLPSGFDIDTMKGPDNARLALLNGQTLLGVDTRTGATLWTYNTRSDAELLGFLGGTLILATGTKPDDGPYPNLLALDPSTGAVRWNRPYPTDGLLLPDTGTLILNTTDGRVDALSTTTGRTAWTTPLSGERSSITVAAGTAFVAGSTLDALDLSTGRSRWAYEPSVPGSRIQSLHVNGDRTYLLDNQNLVALDTRTGRRLWSANTPAADTAPLLTFGGLICTGVAGPTGPGLYAWTETTGHLTWSRPAPFATTTDQWTLTKTGQTLAALNRGLLQTFATRPQT